MNNESAQNSEKIVTNALPDAVLATVAGGDDDDSSYNFQIGQNVKIICMIPHGPGGVDGVTTVTFYADIIGIPWDGSYEVRYTGYSSGFLTIHEAEPLIGTTTIVSRGTLIASEKYCI